jgi:hypothetical protein
MRPADYVIDSVADLSHVLDDIEGRLAAGERPGGRAAMARAGARL